MSKNIEYKKILESTSIIAGSSILNIIFGLIRMKFAALILGPAGIGLVGLIQTFINTFVSIISIGIPQAGIRLVAVSANDGMLKLENTKKALFTLSAVMAILSILISFLFQKEISEFFFKNSDYNNSVVWLGAGVALSVFSSAQIALLNGLGKIKILAILTIINSFVSLTFGVIFLNLWGKEGLLFFILVGPAANFLVGGYFTNRIKYSGNDKSEKKVIFPEIKKLLHMGIGLMLIGVAWSIAHLMIRATIQDKLGVIELGYFQASWTVGTFYLSFILNGLGSDYYPRLSAVIKDKIAARKIINEQTEITLLLTSPILLFALSISTWLINILYSAEFSMGTDLLRWQILSDVLKVITWPLSYYILATGSQKLYLITEIIAIIIFVAGSLILIPYFGIKAVGISSTLIFIVILPINYMIANKNIGFRWTKRILLESILLILLSLMIFCIGVFSKLSAAYIGIFISISWGLLSLKRLIAVYEKLGVLRKFLIFK